MSEGVILYGPPAAGKDTITAALVGLDACFQLFERIKSGPGRTTGYRMKTDSDIAELRAAGEIIWENARYGATYVIDRPTLREMIRTGVTPVVHAGQPEVVDAVLAATPGNRWTVVALTNSRDTAYARIVQRATGDTGERMAAWDATPHLPGADLSIDTDEVPPDRAAALIRSLVLR